MVTFNSTLQKIDVLTIIKEAKKAELCRDLELQIELLQPIWNDFDQTPDFSNHELPIEASLLKISGYFLSNYGRSKSIPEYQERGKDLINKSIRIFEELKLVDKASEAKCHMAMCYLREGKTQESYPYLIDAESAYLEHRTHPMNLQIQIDKLIGLYWNNQKDEINEIIGEMNELMRHCSDNALLSMYHNQVGICLNSFGKVDEGIFHKREAIRFAKLDGNIRFVAKMKNNLAYSFIAAKNFSEAQEAIDYSIATFEKLNDSGWLGNVLDTKARLLLAMGKIAEANKLVIKAAGLLESTGDAVSYIDCLWTQIEIYCAQRDSYHALEVFVKLANIAKTQVSEIIYHKFVAKFNDLLHIKGNTNFRDEIKLFEKELIEKSLIKNDFKIGKAAAELGLSDSTLSNKTFTQLPELRKNVRLASRKPRSVAKTVKTPKPSGKKKKATDSPFYCDGIIMPVNISEYEMSYQKFHPADSEEGFCFIFPEHIAKRFNIDSEAIVYVIESELRDSIPVLICHKLDGIFETGYVKKCDFSGVYYFENNEAEPIDIEDTYVVGIIIGFAKTCDIKGNEITFNRL